MQREPILLVDCAGYAEMILDEASSNDGVTFRGKFQEVNKPNKNRRIYKKEALDRNMKQLEEAMKTNGLFGELDHSTDSIIHLQNASHIITKLWWEGETLMGEGRILPTPSGKILRSIAEAGGRWGISSRGLGNGSTNSDGVLVIDESYKLITFDAVADPSTFGAYPNMKKKLVHQESFIQRPAEHKAEVTKPAIEPEVVETLIKSITGLFTENFRNK